jgi:hypothetical protein
MNIDNIAGTGAYLSGSPATSRTGAETQSFDDVLSAFQKEAAKTPAERARDEVLKKHELSEEDYKKLPPEKRDPIDKEIVEAVRRACARESAGAPRIAA